MKKLFNIISIDPPFGFSDKLKQSDVKRGAEANYKTMSNADIKKLKIKELSDPAASIIALWVPSSLVSFGLECMKEWGFEQKQIWVWVKSKQEPLKKLESLLIDSLKDQEYNKKNIQKIIKDYTDNYWYNDLLSFGMGKIGRNVHEIALIGTRGKINSKIINKSERTVFFDVNTKHSKKSEILQDKLDKIFPDPNLNRIEIFGRRLRKDWIVVGNECPSSINEDIGVSIDKLLQ